MLPEVRIRLFLQCDPAGRRPAKIQFRKIRSSAAAEERKPAAAHAEGGIAPPAASGLVDQLNLQVFPVILGSGRRIFPDTPDTIGLTLASSQALDNGVVLQSYRPA